MATTPQPRPVVAFARQSEEDAGSARVPQRPPEPATQDERIPVELAGVTRYLRRSQVRYVVAQGDYARLHTATGSHLVRIPLTVLEDRWAAAGFVRIHRSTLVALRHVDEVRLEGGRFSVRLGPVSLPVSRRYGRSLRELLLRGLPRQA